MSTARENFELAQQRYAATFERHLDNGVNFISDNVCIEPEVVKRTKYDFCVLCMIDDAVCLL